MWRSNAETVRNVETIRVGLSCLGLILMIVSTLAMGPSIVDSITHQNLGSDPNMTILYNENIDEESREAAKKIVMVALYVSLGIFVICLFVEIFLTRMLWKACSTECEVSVSLKNARRWRNVRLFFLIFFPFTFYYFYQQTGILLIQLCVFIWHIWAIFVIDKFSNELQEHSQIDNFVPDGMINREESVLLKHEEEKGAGGYSAGNFGNEGAK